MQRYSNLIGFVCVICLGIGLFYGMSKATEENHPHVKLQKLAGDDEHIKDVILKETIQIAKNTNIDTTITKDKTSYQKVKDNWWINNERMSIDSSQSKIHEWQSKYRSFMRGKETMLNQYDESSEELVYGNILGESLFSSSKNKFDIAVLNKKTKESHAFQLPLTEISGDEMVHVEQVYRDGEELQMIVQRESLNGGKNKNTVTVYTFDLKKEKLVNQQEIAAFETENTNQYTVISVIPKMQEKERTSYAVIEEQKYSEESIDGEALPKANYILYDYKTKEAKTLDVPESKLTDEDMYMYNNILYRHVSSDEKNQIEKINIKTNEREKIDLSLERYDQENHDIFMKRIGKRLFIYEKDNRHEQPTLSKDVLHVIDDQTGELLYKGKIVQTDETFKNENVVLNLQEIATE